LSFLVAIEGNKMAIGYRVERGIKELDKWMVQKGKKIS
jgi:hypothetical protein